MNIIGLPECDVLGFCKLQEYSELSSTAGLSLEPKVGQIYPVTCFSAWEKFVWISYGLGKDNEICVAVTTCKKRFRCSVYRGMILPPGLSEKEKEKLWEKRKTRYNKLTEMSIIAASLLFKEYKDDFILW